MSTRRPYEAHEPEPRLIDFEGVGGVRLSCTVWDTGEGTGRILIFLHGIGAYGEIYGRKLAPGLMGVVDAIYTPDLRGHGRSGGPRGRHPGPVKVLGDVGEIVRQASERHPGAAVVLGGESMGGLISLNYAARSAPGEIAGLVLVAPGITVRRGVIFTPEHIAETVAHYAAGKPPFRAHGGSKGQVHRDPDYHAENLADPLMIQHVGHRYIATLGALQSGWRATAKRLAMPVLVEQGEADQLLDMRGAAAIAKLSNGTLLTYPDAWHNLFWDPHGPQAIADMAEWLRGIGPSPSSGGA